MVLSADANFGLVRKKSAGNQVDIESRDFFVKQNEVDLFLENYGSRSEKNEVNILM